MIAKDLWMKSAYKRGPTNMTNMAQQASNRAASFDSEALPAFDEKRRSMSSESIVASELSVTYEEHKYLWKNYRVERGKM